jgi:histidinol-phosphatase (PHP family)
MAAIIDSHTHSNFSPDSSMTIREAMEAAEKIGLAGVAFTDHLDLKTPDGDMRFAFDPALQQREAILHRQNSKVYLLSGVEIGLQPGNLKETSEYLSNYQFDTIIASVHFVDGVDPYKGDYYLGLQKREAYGRYLELIYELTQLYQDFDILGHYDYISRYAPYKTRSLFYREFPDKFDAILSSLSQSGKSIEINTNTYRHRNGETPLLDLNIFKRFRELGGEFVSIGSDAHTSERIGEQFEYYLFQLKSCGFKYITHFKERKAVPVKL